MAFVAVYAARATSPSVRRHRQCSQGHASTISTAASAGGRSNEDQWTQHDNIDDAGLLVAKESLNSTHQTRQAHSFIVSDVTALSLIESAIVRHGDSLAQTGPVAFGRRLIIGRGIVDPLAGIVGVRRFRRNMPYFNLFLLVTLAAIGYVRPGDG
jgi:hypothetical protein